MMCLPDETRTWGWQGGVHILQHCQQAAARLGQFIQRKKARQSWTTAARSPSCHTNFPPTTKAHSSTARHSCWPIFTKCAQYLNWHILTKPALSRRQARIHTETHTHRHTQSHQDRRTDRHTDTRPHRHRDTHTHTRAHKKKETSRTNTLEQYLSSTHTHTHPVTWAGPHATDARQCSTSLIRIVLTMQMQRPKQLCSCCLLLQCDSFAVTICSWQSTVLAVVAPSRVNSCAACSSC